MKNILIAGIVLAMAALYNTACNNTPTTHPHDHGHSDAAADHGHAHLYICPMNCEKGKTYDKPGTCPICNMDLDETHAEDVAKTIEYFTAFVANPTQLEAGKTAQLSFTPKIKGNEAAPVPLDLLHEKKMHLILVSDDLSWFDHIHPDYSASGSYDIKVLAKADKFTNGRGHNETHFETGGKYWAFTDYKPSGGLNQVNKTELNISGTPSKPASYTKQQLATTVDGYQVQLLAKDLKVGSAVHIPVMIGKGGMAVDPTTFENYLGEKAHVIMLETKTKAFIHTHPTATGSQLDIHTTFAQPGTYRGWLQFQTEGKVHTADFVLVVGG